jgi:aspartyl-tRNA(Asn)/glutamyl-tRNA(Gln) amidotransferase subunit B
MEYEAVIGLETHVQLKTQSKMWCGCANAFGSEPNTNVCPVCLGLPGVLPVPNEEALRLTVLTGYLLNCEIPRFAKFDRKSYFYPDMPKNYQLTQYDKPSTANGFVEFEFNGGLSRVRITRAHLEEDVGKSTHFERHSGVDFNRAGVPLMEIVSEPDLTSADMAYAYLNTLTEILHQGGVSDCDMEKGMVRCDVNVSVRPIGSKELGAKIEIKNMNSFSGVRRALEYEIPRQIEAVKRGEKLIQSTRRWDDVTGITEQMRTKEDAHDYRYFPDPDLMPLEPTAEWLAAIKAEADRIRPFLPLNAKRSFLGLYGPEMEPVKTDYGIVMRPKLPLTHYDAAALSAHPASGALFRREIEFENSAYRDYAKPIANIILNNLKAEISASGVAPETVDYLKLHIPPSGIAWIAKAQAENQISSASAQVVFHEMYVSGKQPEYIVKEKGLAQVSDTGEIEKFCDEAIAANPNPVADYKAGKVAALNSLKGQVMKLSKGKANPALVGEILERKLKM